jgi:Flp pilus assembly pilin Flp
MTNHVRHALEVIQIRIETIRRSEAGQGLVEYALILAFISVLAIAALKLLSGALP